MVRLYIGCLGFIDRGVCPISHCWLGRMTQGLFRISASHKVIQSYREKYNTYVHVYIIQIFMSRSVSFFLFLSFFFFLISFFLSLTHTLSLSHLFLFSILHLHDRRGSLDLASEAEHGFDETVACCVLKLFLVPRPLLSAFLFI